MISIETSGLQRLRTRRSGQYTCRMGAGDETVTPMVDALLDRACQDHPEVEFTIVLSRENSLLLPMHGDRLKRVVNGRVGSYGAHVYRDAMVEPMSVQDHLVIVQPVDPVPGQPRVYCGDLRSGKTTTSLADLDPE